MKTKFLLTTSLLIILVIAFTLINKIKIYKITCQSQWGPCNTTIESEIKDIEGQSVIDAKSSIKDKLENILIVKNYSVQYKFPMELRIDVIEKSPRYSLMDKNSGQYYIVDNEGYIIKLSDSSNLPLIVMENIYYEIGNKLAEDIIFPLELQEDMFQTYQIKNGLIMDNKYSIVLQNGMTAIFPREGDREVLLGSLILIYQELNNSDQDPRIKEKDGLSEIDLRFKNPVIR